MGLDLLSRKRRVEGTQASEEALKERFGTHYPRLFAYVCAWLGDDAAASETVVEAFSRAFASCANGPDDEFRLVLFGLARDLCRSAASGKTAGDGVLSSREGDVLSLLFDGHLSRGEIGRLLKVREQTVTSALMRGLKKLRASTTQATMAAYLRLP